MDAFFVFCVVILSAVTVNCNTGTGKVCKDAIYGACSPTTRRFACYMELRGTMLNCNRTCGFCYAKCDKIKPWERRDCGYYGITQRECFRKGCCWSPLGTNSKQPWCFHSRGTYWRPYGPSNGKCEDTFGYCSKYIEKYGCDDWFMKFECAKSCNFCKVDKKGER
ncbi:uncharacterized protein LOC130635684 [Hydractinia symbiolongicarpus]|uniref:uncharacterized protein LOC130635684 n=1 Tax=Hydractinia symbiolongicarpus TaxID=13093 RepID=UPI00254B742A|nr:uncharacterized protein LOC130635684 [Hydractinia symbiolongicarpus]